MTMLDHVVFSCVHRMMCHCLWSSEGESLDMNMERAKCYDSYVVVVVRVAESMVE